MIPAANIQAEPTPDDRVHCSTCLNRCKGMIQPRRCCDYLPNRQQADQRNGRQRWPMLEELLKR